MQDCLDTYHQRCPKILLSNIKNCPNTVNRKRVITNFTKGNSQTSKKVNCCHNKMVKHSPQQIVNSVSTIIQS
jgi:hypothetical protein